MRQTLRQANVAPESIGHVHAHGLGTRTSDIAEARAIHEVFGQRIPVVAAKSHLAHAGTGSGALELLASLLALRSGNLFPARNLGELDPECPIRLVTTDAEPAGESFLNVNLFGRGLASCVAVRAFHG
jgi:3-oxoacyl-[acyl-carrier-protein] synthase II